MADPVTSPVNSGDPAGSALASPHGTSPSEAKKKILIPDLKPFSVESIFLAWLDKYGVRPKWVYIGTACIVLLAVFLSTFFGGVLVWSSSKKSFTRDLWLFFIRLPSESKLESMPYLRDYPALALTVVIILAVPFVYGLFRSMSELHSGLVANECIRAVDDDARRRPRDEVNKFNKRLKKLTARRL